MKALLLADFYQGKKYLRSIFLIVVVFAVFVVATGGSTGSSLFFPFYAMLLAGLLSMSLLAYDEQSRWNEYALILPCTRRQQVSVKYADSLIGVAVVWVLFTAIFIALTIRGSYSWSDTVTFSSLMLAVGLIGPSILMPVVFRFGVTKGRMVYYVVIILVAGGGGAFMAVTGGDLSTVSLPSLPGWMAAVLPVVIGAVLFAASWALAIRWYEKREL